MIKFLRKLNNILIRLGFNIRDLVNLRYFPLFLSHRRKWLLQGGKIDSNFMILDDFKKTAGINKGHYFHQDLLVAQFIYENKPKRHIDIGSKIDGFVSHVASFREIEVLDIRKLDKTNHKNIKFTQMDIMQQNNEIGYTDSLSCLHALEHFGLGRYNDEIDIDGYKKGLRNMIQLLKKGGYFYVSFPIGSSDEVYFNAHRIFHPKSILLEDDIIKKMKLIRFDYVDDVGNLHIDIQLKNFPENLKYGCGIYTFKKND